MRRLLPALLVLSAALASAGDAVLNHDTLDAWRARIDPSPEELAADTLPWEPNLLAGVREAAKQDKPLFLWVMNGHPLGCT